MAQVKNHTPGRERYFTYYLEFPGKDPDVWVEQVPFVHPIDWELKNRMTINKSVDPSLGRDLLLKGECQWTDANLVRHRIVVENEKRPRRWGKGNLTEVKETK